MNQNISGKLYFKILVKIDGFKDINLDLRNSGLGSHVKRTILFISLNNRYMLIPVKRVKTDSKPYKNLSGIIVFCSFLRLIAVLL